MKKTVLAAALGIVVSAAPVCGQGYIAFNNYGATDAIVTFDEPGFPHHGQPVGGSFKAGLLYSFGGGSLVDLGVRRAFNPLTPGYFQGPIVTIPGYSSGTITFQVFAYYAYPQNDNWNGFNPTYYGQSAPFILPSITTGIQPVGDFGSSLQPFTVHYIPEPSTIALVGLGLVSLLFFVRKDRKVKKD